jgi:hypothetical protein
LKSPPCLFRVGFRAGQSEELTEMGNMLSQRHRPFRAALLAVFAIATGGAAAYANPSFNKPVYNPDTKSYFELFSPSADDPKVTNVKNHGAIKFTDAQKLASSRIHKGVRGRLAVIPNEKVHEFLAENLKPDVSAWIGLRFYCRFKKLMWVNGKVLKPGKDFAVWGPQTWNVDGPSPRNDKRTSCWRNSRDFYLPVHYWPMSDGFRWNANGYAKEWNALIIEYRTGKP